MPAPVLSPPATRAHIPVVLGFTEDFAPYAYATMQSAVNCALPGVKLVFYAFHERLSERAQEIGRALFNNARSEIHFVDVSYHFDEFPPATPQHGSRSQFYRLLIPRLCKGFEKVIYLDSDTMVLRCLSLLYYRMDRTKPIGATRDLLLKLAQDESFRLPPEIAGGVGLIDYHRGALGVHNSDDYFQSGVLVFNLPQISEHDESELLTLSRTLFWMMDQDVLNRVFFGRVHFIDPKWDVCIGPNCVEEAAKLPEPQRGVYDMGLHDPFILHYTGFPKPWNGWEGSHTHHYMSILNPVLDRFK